MNWDVKSETPIPVEDSMIHKCDTAKLQNLKKIKDTTRLAHYTKEAPFHIHTLQICVVCIVLLDLLTLEIGYREDIYHYVFETFDSWKKRIF